MIPQNRPSLYNEFHETSIPLCMMQSLMDLIGHTCQKHKCKDYGTQPKTLGKNHNLNRTDVYLPALSLPRVKLLKKLFMMLKKKTSFPQKDGLCPFQTTLIPCP